MISPDGDEQTESNGLAESELELLNALEKALPAMTAAALDEARRNVKRLIGKSYYNNIATSLELYESATACIDYLKRRLRGIDA